ncbi:MAG: FHA domain-containing protein [Xanthomonadaceae bacterium]|nr:FHA domain-containing protein [Xanthomonadaceae bacterium]
MYKLKIVAGPNRGATFEVQEGETSIGRNPDNVIILPSNRISKKHCSLYLLNGEPTVQDHGSSNGTFVNGSLSKNKKIKSGDRISVGEFILEFTDTSSKRKSLSVQGMDNVLQFPTSQSQQSVAVVNQDGPPKNYQEKAKWYVEKGLLPFFYGLLLKYDWKIITAGLMAILLTVGLLVSIQPLIDSHQDTVVRESEKRAAALARQIVEKNAIAIANQAETKTDIGIIEREDGVDSAVLIDLKARIISPPEKMNQYFTKGNSAVVAIEALRMYERGKREAGYVKRTDDLVVAIEPLKVFDPTLSKNTIRAVAVVGIDITQAAMAVGEIGLYYSESLVVVGVVALLVFYILLRITLKPFEVLNEDLDKILRGEMSQITHEFKFDELNSLWEVLGSVIQRIPKAGGDSGMAGGSPGASVDEFIQTMRSLGELGFVGVVICDGEHKLLYANKNFEDVTGIRMDAAAGKSLPELARDQAFTMFVKEIFAKAASGAKPVEDLEFSGVAYKAMASHQMASGAHAYALVISKKETS